MPAAGLYYRHSGKFSIAAALTLVVAGVVSAIIVGGLYGGIAYYMPLIYINILMTLGVGALMGLVMYGLAKATHIRLPALPTVIGLVCGIVAEYVACATWLLAVDGWPLTVGGSIEFALDPVWVGRVLVDVGQQGVWGLSSGAPVSGAPLFAIWVAETVIIIGFATVMPYRKLARLPYCEACRKWVEDSISVLPFEPVKDPKAMRASLENGDFAVLGSLNGVSYNAPDFTRYELLRCTGCDDMHLLTIRSVSRKTDSKGKVEEKKSAVVQNLIVDAESRELILELDPRKSKRAT